MKNKLPLENKSIKFDTCKAFFFVLFTLCIGQKNQAQVVSTLAGSGTSGSTNGTGTAASFNSPSGVTSDNSGNVYVADFFNNKIRKITPAGVVTTFAGSGISGSADGTGTAATFNGPYGVTADAANNIYVADFFNHKIRKITPAGVVSTFAGSGTSGSSNGSGTSASFNSPSSIAIDGSGNLFVADAFNHLIRKITPAGVVTTFAGTGSSGNSNGTGTAASFNFPYGIAIDGSDNLFVADFSNNLIRKITPTGVVSTLAGSGSSGNANGTGTAASFNGLSDVACDISGNVYAADYFNHSIRKVTSTGVVSTFAGTGASGNMNGTGTAASFNGPTGICLGPNGHIYIGDQANNLIRKITITPSCNLSSPLPTASGTYVSNTKSTDGNWIVFAMETEIFCWLWTSQVLELRFLRTA